MKVLKGAGCVTNNKLLLVILEFLKEFLPFQYGAIVQMLLITSQVSTHCYEIFVWWEQQII